MKRCPKCSRTFPDENQKFCTVDGGLLMHDPPAATFDPNLTVSTTSRELPPLTGAIDASEAPTSVQLPNMEATVASFGTSNVTPTAPTGAPTSADLVPPMPPAAQTSADLVAPAMPPPTPVSAPPPAPADIAPPVQPTSQPLAAPVAVAPPVASAAPPKKKSAMKWVLVGLLVLLLLGGGGLTAGYFFVLKPWLEARNARTNPPVTNEKSNTNTNGTNTNSASNTNNEPKKEMIFVPPANALKFENSKANLDGKLLEHYLDFSFYYLNSWAKDPKAGVPGAGNFVSVERKLPPSFPQESFAVGWYNSKGTFALDKDDFPRLVEQVSSIYAKNFSNYQKVSEGATKVNALDAYEFRFESLSAATAKGDIKGWGRVIFLPTGVDGGKSGVTLFLFTTSLAPEIHGTDDVGVKGELPVILDSFRFGASH